MTPVLNLLWCLAALACAFLAGIVSSRLVCRKKREGRCISDRETVERYKILTDNLAAAVVIRDPSGKIVYCSPFTEVLTGYPLDEIYSCPEDFFLNIASEKDKGKLKRALEVASCGEAFQFRHRFLHKTGIKMWAETRVVPVLSGDGGISSILSISVDVTGSVRYQEQIEEKNKDLEDFSYMISHDLKAPIFTVKGMVNILKSEDLSSLTEDAREAINHIEDGISRLEKLVAAVLEYSKTAATSNPMESIDLKEVIKAVLNDYSKTLKDISAEISLFGDDAIIVGDETMVYQIFSNMVGNAIKYRADSRPLKITIAISADRIRGWAQVTVSDNGIGIPQDRIADIFRPFKRAHTGKREGLGIGLACVKKLVEKLGGTIEVASEEGKGTSFVVSFPLSLKP